MAKKKEPEKLFALVHGELVEVDEPQPTVPEFSTNEPLDRTRITDETKKELGKLLKKLPEIKPVLDILIGKAAVEKL